MDIQYLLVIVIFLGAAWYLGRKAYRSLFSKGGSCESGCGKCGADLSNIPSPPSKNG